jgi:uridine kinase
MTPLTPYIIGIAGASCSGKTSVANDLSSRLTGHPPLLTLDSYYRDFSPLAPVEREKINFDIPKSLDHDLIIEHICLLMNGKSIEKPIYDYAIHLRKGITKISPAGRFLIVEGLYALYWEDVRNLFDLKIFIDLDDDIAFERRIKRDVRERGSTREYVIRQYKMMVKPMFDKYVLPTRKYADLILTGTIPIEESAGIIANAIRKKTGYSE